MPVKYFICPTGKKVEIEQCLKGCPFNERCMSLPTLRAISKQRKWTGKPSTTQLINGTRLSYIEIMYDDLEVDPQDCMFMLLGTKVHLSLEELTGDMLAEEKVEEKEVTGIFDLYDHTEKTLWDYKTSGSYKIAKALGLYEEEVPVPGQVFRTGPRKGQPKTEKITRKGTPDCKDWELQLNRYRLMLQDMGFPIEHIKIEAIARDGSTYIAKSRGIKENCIIIPIAILDDKYVREYFKVKSELLLHYLDKKELPPPCNGEECWDGNRCKGYCKAWKHCDVGIRARQGGEAVNE
jgi:hypothetical protein